MMGIYRKLRVGPFAYQLVTSLQKGKKVKQEEGEGEEKEKEARHV